MPELVFPLDSTKSFTEQQIVGHNRWHPDIPAAVTVKKGDSFRVHCREWFDGAIVNDDSADDILNAPLLTVHKLSGPFAVEGASPGDSSSSTSSTSDPFRRRTRGPWPGRGGATPESFRPRTAAVFSPSSFPMPTRQFGIFAARPRDRGTSLRCRSRASSTPV